jgi:hypothetical protein
VNLKLSKNCVGEKKRNSRRKILKLKDVHFYVARAHGHLITPGRKSTCQGPKWCLSE